MAEWIYEETSGSLFFLKPGTASATRTMGVNMVAVGKVFDLLGGIVDKYKLTPDRMLD